MDNISTEIIITNSAGTVLKNTDYDFEFSITPPKFISNTEIYEAVDEGLVGAGRMFSCTPNMTRWKKIYKISR